MTDTLIQLLIVSLATSAISITIGRSKVTVPIRSWLMERAFMLAQLVSCPYCLSHWVAAAFVIPLGLNPLSDAGWFVGYSVSIFAVVGMSALITGAVLRPLLTQESEIRALEGALNDAKKTIKDFLS